MQSSSMNGESTRSKQNGQRRHADSLRRPSIGPSAEPRQLRQIESEVKSTLGDKKQMWTFSSSGWLFVYFFGVIKCLRDLKLNENIHVIGSSGGACAGSFLFLEEVDIDACVEYVKECAVRARSSWRDALRISEYVQGAIDRFQPPGAAKRLEDNMEISVSKLQLPWAHWPPLPLRNVRLRRFSSDAQMGEAVVASARIVPVPPVSVSGVGLCIDGVYTDSQLVSSILLGRSFFTLHLEDAISVCPFYSSRADIVPSRYVPPTWAAYPPEPEKLGELYELGYRDALAWLLKNGKVPYGVANPDETADTADSGAEQTPAWRQRLTNALASVQAQMAEGAAVLRDGAQAAVGCDAAAEELVTEAVTGFQSVVSLLAWCLIIWEMFVHTCISATVAAWAPVLPLNTTESWRRFTAVSKSMTSPRLFLKIVPSLGPHIDLKAKKNREFAENLKEHSVLYRVLQYVLL
jgi:hypothetical protein